MSDFGLRLPAERILFGFSSTFDMFAPGGGVVYTHRVGRE
jgi:hypothetical protein